MCLAVLYLCIIWVHIRFMCVYLEFTLLSSTWWTQNGFKSAHREHKKSWTDVSTNLLVNDSNVSLYTVYIANRLPSHEWLSFIQKIFREVFHFYATHKNYIFAAQHYYFMFPTQHTILVNIVHLVVLSPKITCCELYDPPGKHQTHITLVRDWLQWRAVNRLLSDFAWW